MDPDGQDLMHITFQAFRVRLHDLFTSLSK